MITLFDVYAECLSEVTGIPLVQCRARMSTALQIGGLMDRFSRAVSPREARQIRKRARKESAAIRRWLAEGAIRARSGQGAMTPAMREALDRELDRLVVVN